MAKTSHMNKKIIFIIGSPRSGTTMLRDVFSKSPEINVLPETAFYSRIWAARKYMGHLGRDISRKKLVWHLLNDCVDSKFQEFQRKKKSLECELIKLESFDHISVFNAVLNTLSSDNHKFVVEKTPQHIFFIKELSIWYPDAKFIYIVRNPVDVISSYIGRADFSKNHKKIAVEWSEGNRIASLCMNTLGDRIINVKYEDIIESPSSSIKKIFQFIGADFEEAYLNVGNNSSFSQKGVNGIAKLRRNFLLTDKQLSQVEYIVSEVASRYQYVGNGKKMACVTAHYYAYIRIMKLVCLLGIRPLGSMVGLGIKQRYEKSMRGHSENGNNK